MGAYDTRGGTPISPDEPCYEPSDLVGKIFGLLEAAGSPTALNDTIIDLIEGWEHEKNAAKSPAFTAADIADLVGPKQ